MTNSRIVRQHRIKGCLLAALLASVFAGSACAWQSPPPTPIKAAKPVLISPSPALRFQQVVQQQKVRDQLQQQQVEQQLHRDVSSNARRPTAADGKGKPSYDQADQAQRERDRARQHDLLDRYRLTPALPRVVPRDLPAPDHDSGNG